MGMTQLLLLLLLCVGVMGQLRLKYYRTSKTWADAQAYCRQYHTDLVTVTDDADNYQITEDSWLGLYHDDSTANWKWSRGDEPLTFQNQWCGSDPTFGEDCVYKEAGYREWRTRPCTQSNYFYCVEEWLVLVQMRKTWEEALAYCRSLDVIDPTLYQNHRYDLATLVTPEEFYYAQRMTQMAKTNRVWTGLRFLGDQWRWVGGEEVQYKDIDKCPTDQRCGSLEKTGTRLYSLTTCQEKNNFLCYKTPPAV